MAPPGIAMDDLPPIDIILLSHNHYDHMYIPALKKLAQGFQPAIYTPLGNRALLEQKKISGATDMDWWDETAINEELTRVCVPAQHFSGRGLFDRNTTLWSGFVIRYISPVDLT